MNSNPATGAQLRIAALRRFAIAISILNVLGHSFLGFEQAWIQPLLCLAFGYAFDLGVELCDARAARRAPAFAGGGMALIDFLLPAHITCLAISMLLYSNERVAPMLMAVAIALGSKSLLRAPVRGRMRHFLNPSNFGIAATLLLFPSVGIAPPYQFTEALTGPGDWILPGIIVMTGSLLNGKYTGRLPLITAWLAGFALQALLRHLMLDASLAHALAPMTGMAFVLFSFYMASDPGTTPSGRRGQIYFGFGLAACYGLLTVNHAVFGLFFALACACLIRGAGLWFIALRTRAPAQTAGPAFTPHAHPGV